MSSSYLQAFNNNTGYGRPLLGGGFMGDPDYYKNLGDPNYQFPNTGFNPITGQPYSQQTPAPQPAEPPSNPEPEPTPEPELTDQQKIEQPIIDAYQDAFKRDPQPSEIADWMGAGLGSIEKITNAIRTHPDANKNSSANNVTGGIIDTGGIMDSIFSYQPGDNDPAGRAAKNTFMYDTAGKLIDTKLATGQFQEQIAGAKDLSFFNSVLDQQASAAKGYQDYVLGSAAQAQGYALENTFQNSEYQRDLGMLGASNQALMDQMAVQGAETRLTNAQASEDARQLANVEGQFASQRQQIAADAQMAAAQSAADASMYGSQASAQASMENARQAAAVGMEQAAVSRANAKVAAGASMAAANARADAQKFSASAQAQAQTDSASIGAESNMYSADVDAASRNYVADSQAAASRDVASIGAQSQMYQADKRTEADVTVAGIRGQTDQYTADTAAEASIYGAGRSAEASENVARTKGQSDQAVAKMGAEASIYGADRSATANENVAKTGAEASVFGSQASKDASIYGSEAGLQGTIAQSEAAERASKYGADKSLEGTKYSVEGTIRNTQEQGNQTRLTRQDETRERAKQRAQEAKLARQTARAF